MLDNSAKALLRAVALDERAPSVRRLNAIDRLAAEENIYITSRYPRDTYVSPGVRAQRFTRHALRKLLATKMCFKGDTRSGVRDRLLFIKTGKSLRDKLGRTYLWRLTSETEKPAPANPVLRDTEIEAALKRFREETHGNHAN
jgi:hypothetical protein